MYFILATPEKKEKIKYISIPIIYVTKSCGKTTGKNDLNKNQRPYISEVYCAENSAFYNNLQTSWKETECEIKKMQNQKNTNQTEFKC